MALALLAPLGSLTLTACSGNKVATVQPELQARRDPLEFGTVPVLQHKALTLDVTNVGRAPLNLRNIFILDYTNYEPAHGGVRAFDFQGERPDQLTAGEAGKITVLFTPLGEEEYRATLHLESDDPNAPSVDIPLHGTGSTRALAKVEATGHPGQQSLDFGRVGEGRVALAGLDVQSLGTADLIVESLELTGASEVSFQSSSRTPVTVPKGQTLNLQLKFAPQEGAAAILHATLTLRTTDPEHQVITVPISGQVNRAPFAAIAQVGALAPGQTLTLDGSGSRDTDGDDPIAFVDALGQPGWTLVRAPINSLAQITPGDQAKPQLTLDLPGQYVVRLTVTDSTGLEALHPAELSLLAKPAQALAIELVWDNADTDVDLHVVPDGQALDGPMDAWANNKTPDWGVPGDPTDDPSLDRDALDHFGPEELTYVRPANGAYDIYVRLYADHGSPTPRTNCTVRVYEYGEVKAEYSQVLDHSGQTWFAAKLTWPSGQVDKVGTVQ